MTTGPEPEKPQQFSAKPEVGDKTEVAATKPEIATDKPEVGYKPEVGDKPEVAVNKPKVAVDKPEVAINKPEVAINRPEVAATKPEVLPPNPSKATLPKPFSFENRDEALFEKRNSSSRYESGSDSNTFIETVPIQSRLFPVIRRGKVAQGVQFFENLM